MSACRTTDTDGPDSSRDRASWYRRRTAENCCIPPSRRKKHVGRNLSSVYGRGLDGSADRAVYLRSPHPQQPAASDRSPTRQHTAAGSRWCDGDEGRARRDGDGDDTNDSRLMRLLPNTLKQKVKRMSTASAKTPEQRSTSALARRIIEQLKDLPVRRILLFGSRVWGDPHPDSDLDVLVVLKGTEEPRTSSKKGALYRRVSRPLRDLQREWPVDLLVHTEGMHRRFRERGGTFARKVLKDGEVIYEDGG